MIKDALENILQAAQEQAKAQGLHSPGQNYRNNRFNLHTYKYLSQIQIYFFL